MISERTEFLISQYVDGTISVDDRAWLESQLAGDADARLLVREYRRLNEVIAAGVVGVPEIDYVGLAARVNEGIDELNARPAYRMPWVTMVGGLVAVAAAVAIAVGVWGRPGVGEKSRQTVAVNNVAKRAVVEVAVLQPSEARLEYGPGMARVEVGPPAGEQPYARVLSEALVQRPNTLFIAKAERSGQDTSRTLY